MWQPDKQGKITHDGHMNRFRKGIEWILKDNPVPVVPVGIGNMWGSFFKMKLHFDESF